MNSNLTQAERITALETQVSFLVQELKETNDQLRQLVDLKNKSFGAFWLASLLFGAGMVGFLALITSWLKGT